MIMGYEHTMSKEQEEYEKTKAKLEKLMSEDSEFRETVEKIRKAAGISSIEQKKAIIEYEGLKKTVSMLVDQNKEMIKIIRALCEIVCGTPDEKQTTESKRNESL